jgi:hypothetical protein
MKLGQAETEVLTELTQRYPGEETGLTVRQERTVTTYCVYVGEPEYRMFGFGRSIEHAMEDLARKVLRRLRPEDRQRVVRLKQELAGLNQNLL